MADEEEDFRAQRSLIEQELHNRELELEALREIGRESGFAPRASLARTPPQGFSTPPVFIASGLGSKRLLSSPEEVQEAVRRRVQTRRAEPSAAPPSSSSGSDQVPLQLLEAPVERLVSLATSSTSGIMGAVKCKTSKLNKDEIAAIGQHVDAVGSVITHLVTRLAAAELRAARAETGARNLPQRVAPPGQEPQLVRSYAGAIKLGRNSNPLPIPARLGPAVAVFPAEDQVDALKTADDTKRALKVAIDPVGLGIKVQGVRKTGGAGVIIQTTSEKDASAFRAALPNTLRVGEARERKPLVTLVGVDADTKPNDMIEQLHEQNLSGIHKLEDLKKNLRPLFHRTRETTKKRGCANAQRSCDANSWTCPGCTSDGMPWRFWTTSGLRVAVGARCLDTPRSIVGQRQ